MDAEVPEVLVVVAAPHGLTDGGQGHQEAVAQLNQARPIAKRLAAAEGEVKELKELKNLSDIFDNYDTFVIDLWGVIHNGVMLNPKAIEAIEQLTNKKCDGRHN